MGDGKGGELGGDEGQGTGGEGEVNG